MGSYTAPVQTGSQLDTTPAGVSTAGLSRARNVYTSLSTVRSFMSLGSADTAEDGLLLSILRRTSRAIDSYTKRHFYPLRRTLRYDYPDNSTLLRVRDFDILEVKGLSDLNGASEIDSSAYWLRCGDGWNQTPYDRIELNINSGSSFNYSGTTQRAVVLDAVTGYHEDYTAGWVDTGASLTTNLGAGITLASVSGSAGMNVFGESPRFETQQILRLSAGTTSEEFVQIIDTAPGTDGSVIKVIRGINGTTTASHASGITVWAWAPELDIEYATTVMTVWHYQAAKNPFTRATGFPELGIIESVPQWPPDIVALLNRYKRRKVYSARFS